MPLSNPDHAAVPIGTMGLMVQNPSAAVTGYSWTYVANAKAFPAYTADVKSSAYTGGLLDLLQAARLADLNATRVALENLRVFTENLAQQHNSISIALRDAGLIAN